MLPAMTLMITLSDFLDVWVNQELTIYKLPNSFKAVERKSGRLPCRNAVEPRECHV